MKKRKHIFRNTIIFIILIIGLFYYFKDHIKDKVLIYDEFNNKISYSEEYEKTDFEDFKNKIISFLNLYYKSIYYLENNDFTTFFDDYNSKEAYLANKAILYQIETRKLEKNDLHLTKASYDLEFNSIEKINNNYEIIVYEDNTINFKFLKNVNSKMYNIKNTFIFDENYNLISYVRDQDFYSLFTENLEENYYIDDIDELYNKYFEEKTNNINEKNNYYEEYLNNKDYSYTCDNEYDRKSAIEYAKDYVTKRNYLNYEMFDDYGGNCQNYGSQVVYNGGIPMDTDGEYIWKFYGNTPDDTNDNYGRSPSWTIVNDFYLYAKRNKDYGLCAEVDVNYFYAEKGDIMQVGYDGEFVHTIVVEDIIKDKENNNIDILTMSNTNDYENIPISSLASPQIRLIKINGYNND